MVASIGAGMTPSAAGAVRCTRAYDTEQQAGYFTASQALDEG
jgi:hypothetical protein